MARFADSGPAGVPLPSGAPLQVGIAAGGATVTAFTTPDLPDGANVMVIATGLLGNLACEDAGFGLLAVTLEPGEQYLAIAAGEVGGDPAFGFIVAQEQFTLDSDDAVVRVIHAAGTGVDAVEVGLVDGEGEIVDEDSVVIDTFVFGDESDEVPLPEAGSPYPLGIGADVMGMANYPNPTVLSADLPVTADTRAYIIASGLLGAMQMGNELTLNVIDTTTSPWTCATCN